MDHESRDTHPSCPICQVRLAGDGSLFCPSHQTAFNNIQKDYQKWANAYGSLTKQEYLQLLAKNANSGEWVVEVAQYLLAKGDVEKL